MIFNKGVLIVLSVCLIAANQAAPSENGRKMDFDEALKETIKDMMKEQNEKVIVELQNEIKSLTQELQTLKEKDAKRELELEAIRGLSTKQTLPVQDKQLNDANGHKDNLPGTEKFQDQLPVAVQMPQHTLTQATGEVDSVAFSAYLSQTEGPLTDQPIRFDSVILNEGLGYDANSGIFTVPVSGLYMFTFTVDTIVASFYGLMIDGNNLADAFANRNFNAPDDQRAQSMGGNSCIVRVIKGQQVKVQVYGLHDGAVSSTYEYHLTTFSGFLIN